MPRITRSCYPMRIEPRILANRQMRRIYLSCNMSSLQMGVVYFLWARKCIIVYNPLLPFRERGVSCDKHLSFPEDPPKERFFFWVALYYDSNVHLLIIFSQSPLRDEVVVIVTSWNATCSDYNVAENNDTEKNIKHKLKESVWNILKFASVFHS